MEMNEYQEKALRTCMEFESSRHALLYSALAIGEAGEYQNLVKKWLFHSHPPDTQAMMDELGDVLWAVAQGAKALGCTLEDIAQLNIHKLDKRYPNGYVQGGLEGKDKALIEYDTIDGKWWEFEDGIATRPLTDKQAANVIWRKEQE